MANGLNKCEAIVDGVRRANEIIGGFRDTEVKDEHVQPRYVPGEDAVVRIVTGVGIALNRSRNALFIHSK